MDDGTFMEDFFNVGPRLGVGGFQVVSFSGGIELN